MLQILDLYKELFSDVSEKKLQHNFPKMRKKVKGRLNFFPKFIRFGSLTRPLLHNCVFFRLLKSLMERENRICDIFSVVRYGRLENMRAK